MRKIILYPLAVFLIMTTTSYNRPRDIKEYSEEYNYDVRFQKIEENIEKAEEDVKEINVFLSDPKRLDQIKKRIKKSNKR